MSKKKKKRLTLPKDFQELLVAGDLASLQSVFSSCIVDARGGYAKQTALAFDECPDELARWLVSQGANLNAVDTWGNTPLHSRSRSWQGNIAVLLELGADVDSATASVGTPLHAAADSKHAENAKLLLAHGALVDKHNRDGLTPLELALRTCTNVELERMPAFVQVMLDAGASHTPPMKGFVQQLGQTFEFHRQGFNPDGVGSASAGLEFLYRTFSVSPVPQRQMHDGKGLIAVKATTWQNQHAELWQLLVPPRGAAKTVQGEVIRISGRISDEWERNGGGNWDHTYAQMANAVADYASRGNSLDQEDLAEIKSIAQSFKRGSGKLNYRFAELAVAWVLRNPRPLPLEKPDYQR